MSTGEFGRDMSQAVVERVKGLGSASESFRAFAEAVPAGIFVGSPQGSLEYASERFCALAGLSAADALGEGWQAAVDPEDLEALLAALAGLPSAGDESSTARFCHPDGSLRLVEIRAASLGDGAPPAVLGICVERSSAASAPSAGETAPGAGERFRLAFEHAPIATALLDADGEWVELNNAFCELLGYERAELLTLAPGELIVPGDIAVNLDPADTSHGESRYLRADGTALWVATSTSVVPGPDGEPLYTIIQVEDIGDRKQAERELRQLADHDALTGLLNRRGFMDGLHRELRRMDRRGEYGALLVLDLDNFKLVNDTAGHLAGDQVLRTTAEVLRRRLRATDVIGRLGGDEFAALVLNVTPRQAREIADETTEALRALTVTAGTETIKVDASIGVVAIDEMRSDNEDDLLAAADRAMYRTKSLRRDG